MDLDNVKVQVELVKTLLIYLIKSDFTSDIHICVPDYLVCFLHLMYQLIFCLFGDAEWRDYRILFYSHFLHILNDNCCFFPHEWTQRFLFYSSVQTFVDVDIFRNYLWRPNCSFKCVCYVSQGNTAWTFKYRRALDMTLQQVKIRAHFKDGLCAHGGGGGIKQRGFPLEQSSSLPSCMEGKLRKKNSEALQL